MKRFVAQGCVFLFMIPIIANAGWQVASPQCAIPSEPFFQAGAPCNRPCGPCGSNGPTSYGGAGYPSAYGMLGRPAGLYAISVSGSLKENIERIMDRYHWRVVWRAPFDFNFDGRITGSSLPNVIEKLLNPFPLQAVMYMSNHTIVVIPRQRY